MGASGGRGGGGAWLSMTLTVAAGLDRISTSGQHLSLIPDPNPSTWTEDRRERVLAAKYSDCWHTIRETGSQNIHNICNIHSFYYFVFYIIVDMCILFYIY